MDSNIKVIGTADLVLVDKFGREKDRRHVNNMIVTSGLGHITSRLVGVAQTVMTHMAIGTNTGDVAAATGQTTLTSEIHKVALTSLTVVTTTLTNDTVQAVATFNAGDGTGALKEAGIFNQPGLDTGIMLNRLVFSVINKGAEDALTITWKLRFASA